MIKRVFYKADSGEVLYTISGAITELDVNTPNDATWVDVEADTIVNIGDVYIGEVKFIKPVTSDDGLYEYCYITRSIQPISSLDKAKEVVRNSINTYKKSEIAKGVEYLNHIYDMDSTSQSLLLNAVNLGLDTYWTDANDMDVFLSVGALSELYIAMINHYSNIHTKSRELKNALNACTTVEGVILLRDSIEDVFND